MNDSWVEERGRRSSLMYPFTGNSGGLVLENQFIYCLGGVEEVLRSSAFILRQRFGRFPISKYKRKDLHLEHLKLFI